MEIRHFQKQDLPQVLALCNEVREHHRDFLHGYFTKQNNEDEQKPYLESLTGEEKFVAWVAETDTEITGLLLARKKFAPYLEAPMTVNVETIGVKKAYRGQGIGKALMDTLLAYCRQNQIQEIKLGVFNKNLSAVRFYEKYGFKPTEQKMNFMVK